MDHLQVVCGVIIKNEKIMICRRGAWKSNAGKWEFPGGKVETFEDPLHALARELTEELQLTAENYCYLITSNCVVGEMMIHLTAYQCDYISGASSSADHDRLEWVSWSELRDYQFTDPDIPIVQFIESQRGGF